jgi:sugar/nucleoside kinase (ribokinase family)
MQENNIIKKVDVLCIGDTVVDAFIRLQSAEIHCELDHNNCTITMPYGAKIPYESSTVLYGVGNSANAAVSLSRLGLTSMLATDLGADAYGEESREKMRKEKVMTNFMRLHSGKLTNYHYVLWYKDERTILVKHFPYERTFDAANLPKCDYVYLSSLGGDSLSYHDSIAKWLNENKETKLVFQPGTFQMQVGRKAMDYFYKNSYIFVCNVEEANYILGYHLDKNMENIKILLKKMSDLGPYIILISDGPAGAYMYYNGKYYFMPPYPDQAPPHERTGAGDAFTSTYLAAIALGLTPLEAITWAPINPMNVVQYIGAQEGLLTKDELLTYLLKASSDYPDYHLREI